MNPSDKVAEYRRLADDCRCVAAGTMHRATKAALVGMAEEYLAKAAELMGQVSEPKRPDA